jgi:hypothetical protein
VKPKKKTGKEKQVTEEPLPKLRYQCETKAIATVNCSSRENCSRKMVEEPFTCRRGSINSSLCIAWRFDDLSKNAQARQIQ